jgi:CRISPR-associated endonuclease/helicase Cas3
MLLRAQDGRIVFPGAYRTWIESVYQEEPWENEPEEMEKAYEKFRDEVEYVKRFKARYMVDSAMNPFADTDEKVTAVTRDGEMNLTIVPYRQGAEGKRLMDGTFLEMLDEYQRLEALAMNSIGVPASWKGYLDNSTADDEGRYWLEMEQDGEFYAGISKSVAYRYHKDMGLERIK